MRIFSAMSSAFSMVVVTVVQRHAGYDGCSPARSRLNLDGPAYEGQPLPHPKQPQTRSFSSHHIPHVESSAIIHNSYGHGVTATAELDLHATRSGMFRDVCQRLLNYTV